MLSYIPCVLRCCLDCVLERSWAGSGFRVSSAPAQPRGATESRNTQNPNLREKRTSHCNSLCASLSWKYSAPKEQGTHKGILCCISLPASGQLWVLDTNSCHKSWDLSLQPSSSASLHKDYSWVCLLFFTVLHLELSERDMDKLGVNENPASWGCWRKLQCHTCTAEDSKCHCFSTTPPARWEVRHYWEQFFLTPLQNTKARNTAKAYEGLRDPAELLAASYLSHRHKVSAHTQLPSYLACLKIEHMSCLSTTQSLWGFPQMQNLQCSAITGCTNKIAALPQYQQSCFRISFWIQNNPWTKGKENLSTSILPSQIVIFLFCVLAKEFINSTRLFTVKSWKCK